MVLEVLADGGVVHDDGDAVLLQEGLAADARELEELGGVEGPGREDDLFVWGEGLLLAVDEDLYACGFDGAGFCLREENLLHHGAGEDPHVRYLTSSSAVSCESIASGLGLGVHGLLAAITANVSA